MNVLSELYTPQLLTIGGIDADTNLIGSVMSVKLMERVQNTTVERGMRRKMVASNIENIAGVSTAIYWIANRQTMRTKYDINKGTTLDRSSGQYVTVNLDQMLNKKFILEKYDQERGQTGDVNLRDGLAQRGIDWIMDSVDANVEGLFMRGAIQYNYAVYPTNPNSLLFMDLHNINNTDQAQQMFYAIADEMVNKQNLITMQMFGTNTEDYELGLDLRAHMKLTHAGMQIYGGKNPVSADVLASGQPYSPNILGLQTNKYLLMNKYLDHNSEQAVNSEIDIDTTGAQGIIIHNQQFAMPMSFQQAIWVMNMDLGQPQLIIKGLGSVPTVIYPNLSSNLTPTRPTYQQILNAQSLQYVTGQGIENGMNWEKAYKLGDNQSLQTHLRFTNVDPTINDPKQQRGDLYITSLDQLPATTTYDDVFAITATNPESGIQKNLYDKINVRFPSGDNGDIVDWAQNNVYFQEVGVSILNTTLTYADGSPITHTSTLQEIIDAYNRAHANDPLFIPINSLTLVYGNETFDVSDPLTPPTSPYSPLNITNGQIAYGRLFVAQP